MILPPCKLQIAFKKYSPPESVKIEGEKYPHLRLFCSVICCVTTVVRIDLEGTSLILTGPHQGLVLVDFI
jgi:hypothetical protein